MNKYRYKIVDGKSQWIHPNPELAKARGEELRVEVLQWEIDRCPLCKRKSI